MKLSKVISNIDYYKNLLNKETKLTVIDSRYKVLIDIEDTYYNKIQNEYKIYVKLTHSDPK